MGGPVKKDMLSYRESLHRRGHPNMHADSLRIGRQSEIRDRIAEGQHYCMAGLKLLAAIIS